MWFGIEEAKLGKPVVVKFQDITALVGDFRDDQVGRQFRAHVSGRRGASGKYEHCVAVGERYGAHELFGQILREKLPRDVLTISEQQLATLFEVGKVELEVPRRLVADMPIEQAIGIVRSGLDGPMTSTQWTSVMEAVERCQLEEQAQLVAYVQQQLERKEVSGKWLIEASHPLMRHAPPKWFEGMTEELMQVAPTAWVLELCLGEHQPKHALIKALHLDGLKLTWGLMKELMQSPHLRQLKVLNVGGNAVCQSVNFYKTLRTHELMRTVEALTLYGLDEKFEQAVEQLNEPEHSFESLKRLDYYYVSWAGTKGMGKKMKRYPCFKGVELNELASKSPWG